MSGWSGIGTPAHWAIFAAERVRASCRTRKPGVPRHRWESRRRPWSWIVTGLLAFGIGCAGRVGPQHADAPPGLSGMVALGGGRYLVVHDTKGDALDPRVSVLEASAEHAQRWWKLGVDWAGHEPASDLESICGVPGKADEFLLCESNYWHGHYGRLFHVRFDARRACITILHVLALPHLGNDIEGCVCTTDAAGKLLVIVGERGGGQGHPGILHWGWLEWNQRELRLSGSKTIAAPGFAWANPKDRRDCADLYLDGQRRLWCVATEDAGDSGPFRSVIYRAATVDADSADPVRLIANPTAEWICEGIKVEALGAPLTDDEGLTIGTDDEDYPGMFRPLFRFDRPLQTS